MSALVYNTINDTAESRLKETRFLLEASSCEQLMLWSQWCAASKDCQEPLIKEWRNLGGWLVTVGQVCAFNKYRFERFPVVVSMHFVSMDGFLVCEWHPTSQVVDHKMIDDWFDKHYTARTSDDRPASCDASNFHHLLHELEEFKKGSKS